MEKKNINIVWLIICIILPVLGFLAYIIMRNKKQSISIAIGTIIGLLIFILSCNILGKSYKLSNLNSINPNSFLIDDTNYYSKTYSRNIINAAKTINKELNYNVAVLLIKNKTFMINSKKYEDKAVLALNSYKGILITIDVDSDYSSIRLINNSIFSNEKTTELTTKLKNSISSDGYYKGVISTLNEISKELKLNYKNNSTNTMAEKTVQNSNNYAYSNEVKQWHQDTEKDEYIITLFALSTCKTCSDYKPVLNDYCDKNNIKLYVFNINELPKTDTVPLESIYLLSDYKKSYPFTFITKNGKYVAGNTGGLNESALNSFVKANVVK